MRDNVTGTTERSGFPDRVEVVEVGLRDGIQAEADWVPTETKIALLDELSDAGIRTFEATSFVSPRAVPQLRDASQVMAGVKRPAGIRLTALVPNLRGAEAAAQARVDAMVVFVSASQSHNQKNLNKSRDESLAGLEAVREVAEKAGITLQGAIATAFGCPFEGDVPIQSVLEVARAYSRLGIRRITLGDTTGMATPALVTERVRALRGEFPDLEIALHFHNTRGIGLVNVYAGLCEGVTIYESSVAGLGGCPFVPNATGNISTEDLLYLLHECGIETGIDLEQVSAIARKVEGIIGRPLPGQVMKSGPRLKTSALDSVRTACG